MYEFAFIEQYLAPLTLGKTEALSLKDDAAVLHPRAGFDTIITKDALVEGVHFFKNDAPYNLARKLLRVNISDLAAKGAEPYCCFLALFLPKHTTEDWLKNFTNGLRADLEEFHCFLAGGDTVAHDGPLSFSLTAIGHVPGGQAILRSGAQEGDLIFTTGVIGESYLGLQMLQESISLWQKIRYVLSPSLKPLPRQFPTRAGRTPVARYHLPLPRLKTGLSLRGIATACTDISDGLLADLGHICKSSGVGAEILLDAIPLSEYGKQAENIDRSFKIKAITAGDDYELLFTAPAEMETQINDIARETKVPITRIGRITSGQEVTVLDGSGQKIAIENSGYTHTFL